MLLMEMLKIHKAEKRCPENVLTLPKSSSSRISGKILKGGISRLSEISSSEALEFNFKKL